jgi:hypothetical protein
MIAQAMADPLQATSYKRRQFSVAYPLLMVWVADVASVSSTLGQPNFGGVQAFA